MSEPVLWALWLGCRRNAASSQPRPFFSFHFFFLFFSFERPGPWSIRIDAMGFFDVFRSCKHFMQPVVPSRRLATEKKPRSSSPAQDGIAWHSSVERITVVPDSSVSAAQKEPGATPLRYPLRSSMISDA